MAGTGSSWSGAPPRPHPGHSHRPDPTGPWVAEALGLDPKQISGLRIEWEGPLVAVARWEGSLVLTARQLAAVGQILATANTAALLPTTDPAPGDDDHAEP